MAQKSVWYHLNKIEYKKKLDPFLKYWKGWWLNRGEPAQTAAKPGLTVRKGLLFVWWDHLLRAAPP